MQLTMLPPSAKPPPHPSPADPLSSQRHDAHQRLRRVRPSNPPYTYSHTQRHKSLSSSLIPTVSKDSTKSSLTASFTSSGSSCGSPVEPQNSSILRGAQILRQQLQAQSQRSTGATVTTKIGDGALLFNTSENDEALHDLLIFRHHDNEGPAALSSSPEQTNPIRRQEQSPLDATTLPNLLPPHSMQVRGEALTSSPYNQARENAYNDHHYHRNAFTPYIPAHRDKLEYETQEHHWNDQLQFQRQVDEYTVPISMSGNSMTASPQDGIQAEDDTMDIGPKFCLQAVSSNRQPRGPTPVGQRPPPLQQQRGNTSKSHEHDPRSSNTYNKDSLNRTVDTTQTEEILDDTNEIGFLDHSRDASGEVDGSTNTGEVHDNAVVCDHEDDDILMVQDIPNQTHKSFLVMANDTAVTARRGTSRKHHHDQYLASPINSNNSSNHPLTKHLLTPCATAPSSPARYHKPQEHGKSSNLLCGSGLGSYLPKGLQNRRRIPVACQTDPAGRQSGNEHILKSQRELAKSPAAGAEQRHPRCFQRPFTLDEQDRFAISSPVSQKYRALKADAGFRHAQNAGNLWQSLVGQHVRFPSEWWCEPGGSARTAPLGCNRRISDKNQWVYYDRHRIMGDPFLVQYVPKRDHPGRLLLHIVVQDFMTSSPILDIAIGCFHPNARHVRSAPLPNQRHEECRDVWMSTRSRTEESISVIDPTFLSAIMGPARNSPLASCKKPLRITNLNVRAVFGELPPIRTVFAPESEVYEALSAADVTNAGPADLLLRRYLFTYDD